MLYNSVAVILIEASTQNYKIEALKLAATVSKNTKTTIRTGTDGGGSTL
ncbi:MAG: hypothetical protein P1P67_08825 [Treponema phagedenis]|uniref:Uncharacterized protein n=1 Tax=Treponema phagedenis TaxID=162 RepID=A0A0B7H1R0_TREPH|nr:hypothetical protein [Treponema phagedenis]NVP25095.1 hypothetical protein [Treponema phagedenis]QKS92890.1 hypothetical protein HPJ96_10240 [Treponema phagedenis]CEM62886.1 hypothetical protein TPHV1_50146 [Treponema phagedenis]